MRTVDDLMLGVGFPEDTILSFSSIHCANVFAVLLNREYMLSHHTVQPVSMSLRMHSCKRKPEMPEIVLTLA